MAITLKQLTAACAVALAAAAVCAPASAAAASSAEHESHPKATKVLKEKAKKAKKSKKEEAKQEVADDEPEPDITDTVVADYACELNNKVTIYTNEKDDGHIALRWKNRLHRLTRVGTTTGALRFENTRFGLIWIGIPSKGILLDSKQNRQLANECKNAEQAKPLVAAAPAEKKS
jgi:membrane-bound inhibitor of C-type lysozyme